MAFSHPLAFYSSLKLFGSEIDHAEMEGLDAILGVWSGQPIDWTAYGLATAYLETAHTMRPIKEYGGDKYFNRWYGPEGENPVLAKRLGNNQPGDGARYAGRGYVQLTGRFNYAKADSLLGLKGALVDDPDKALQLDIAAKVMLRGMTEGWFTAKGLASYLPAEGHATFAQFVPARHIINGSDRAEEIASAAVSFQTALDLGGWQ